MEFGPVPLDRAMGAILAHSVEVAGGRLRKGAVLGPPEVAALQAAGIATVTVARPGSDDVPEDAAAARLARALVPSPVEAGLALTEAFTGRVNLKATRPGIVEIDAGAVHALNLIDPALTLATLAPLARVEPGTLVGTVKIIAYAVTGTSLSRAEAVARAAIRIRPVEHASAGLLMTEVPGQEARLAAKGRRAVEARLARLGMALAGVVTVPHETQAMARALADLPGAMVLILTGSATSDLHDTAPEAVRLAGGKVARFGMPVDPGNLLFHGSIGDRPLIGLPGCARSPALNGADWVLERLACGLALGDAEIAAMGLGGLLKEIATRPQPREPRERREP